MATVAEAQSSSEPRVEQNQEALLPDAFTRFVDSHPPIRLGLENFDSLHHPSIDGVYLETAALSPQFGPREIIGYEQSEQAPPIDYETNPNRNIGAANSHHGVTFGEVQILTEGRGTVTMDIAVKPFEGESGRHDAMNEYECLVAAKGMGYETYTPFGIAIENGTTYLLTHYRKGLTTYDNIDWTISSEDRVTFEAEIVPALEFLVTNLAEMHTRGFFHGDAQVKNFAKALNGKFAVMDLEDCVIATDEADLVQLFNGGDSPEEGKAYRDVSHMWYALTHQIKPEYINILFGEESREVCIREFNRCVLNPYFKALERHAPAHLYSQLKVEEIKQALKSFVERTS